MAVFVLHFFFGDLSGTKGFRAPQQTRTLNDDDDDEDDDFDDDEDDDFDMTTLIMVKGE